MPTPVETFRDDASATFTHLVHDGGRAAVIDPVLAPDGGAAAVLDGLPARGLTLDWILETHAHADHVSAGAWLRARTGAKLGIGRGIVQVQRQFADRYPNSGDGREFDRLFDDGYEFALGALPVRVIATPGHTADGVTYLIGDAAFIGDTLFAPDTGSARCDFPGGDARGLHASIAKLLALPAGTRLFLCHDYPKQRAPRAEWSIEEQRGNLHLQGGVEDYVALRTARDATLPPPKLLEASLRANLRGGG